MQEVSIPFIMSFVNVQENTEKKPRTLKSNTFFKGFILVQDPLFLKTLVILTREPYGFAGGQEN